ncbi:hypothetical protein PRK78_000531 [Emydomyces testavorans]|uniref:Uncharacterized protein n=1 Tax=Emydomyces testavorans TaxID=2070801 RepID=A0AAF0DB87_9EURO|nr:hypothetical protein PRK78_000531 [Emydomyces testavorans]
MRVIRSTKRASTSGSLRFRPQASWVVPIRGINANRFAHSEASEQEESRPHDKHDREPHCSESASFAKEFDERVPSNKARPTLSEAYQHSGIDAKHPKRPPKEELSAEDSQKMERQEDDVKRHNEDIERRYDRAINQVSDKGEIGTLNTEVKDTGHIKGE